MGSPYFRLRVRFRKAGRLRYLSHLEVSRACERAVRRSGLPYVVTRGFTPRVKVAFGPALPVGTGGEREYYDLWLSEHVPAAEALHLLAEKCPDELSPAQAGYVLEKLPSLNAVLAIALYDVVVETAIGPEIVSEGLEEVTSTGELVVERQGRTKVFDLAEVLPKKAVVSSQADGVLVNVTTRMGPAGSLRPEALVEAALARRGISPGRVTVTRTDLLAEEGSDWRRPLS